MDKILITGGSGFIGSHLAKKLLSKYGHVRVLDNYFRGTRENLKGLEKYIEFYKGDILDSNIVTKALKGVDVVYHFAAINGTRFFYEIPEEVLRVNVGGLINVLGLSVKARIHKFIFSSSSEVYNVPELIPTPEVQKVYIPDIKNPRFSYSGSKIIGELFCIHYGSKFNIKTIILRYHNVYGPNMGFEHVIPELILKIKNLSNDFAKKRIKLPIQGTGRESRAFCYVNDAIEATILCADKGKGNEIFNIGNDKEEISIQELISLMSEILNIKIDILIGEKRKGGTDRRCPDIHKIRRLGFEPRTSLREGLQKTIDSYLKHNLRGSDAKA